MITMIIVYDANGRELRIELADGVSSATLAVDREPGDIDIHKLAQHLAELLLENIEAKR